MKWALLIFLGVFFSILEAQETPSAEEQLVALLLSEQYAQAVADFHLLEPSAKQEKIALLTKTLENQNFWIVRQRSAEALGKIGKEAISAVPVLIKTTQDRHGYVCCLAIWALGEMGEDAKESIPILTHILRSKDFIVPIKAAEALGKMGDSAKSSIPALIETLKYKNPDARFEAAKTLGKFRSQEATPALIELLNDKNGKVRHKAIEVLGKLQSTEAVSALIKRLEAKDLKTRLLVIEALGEIGEREKTVSALLPLLKDSSSEVVYKVANLLGQKGWATEETIGVLKQALTEDDPDTRKMALQTFGIMRSLEAFADVLKALHDPHREVQSYAIWALGEIGSREASLSLTELSKTSPSPKIRQEAEEALAKLNR